MADKDFVVKNGLVVNSAFQANTTQITIPSTVGLNANGSFGSAGQALSTNGSAVYWADSVNTAAQYTWSNTHSFTNTVTIKAVSANGTLGTAGQVLTSNGTSTFWSAAVNTSAQYTWSNTHTFTNTVAIKAISANSTLGTSGQMLTTNGSAIYWSDSVNASSQYVWTNTHTFTNTVTFSNTIIVANLSANGSTGTAGQLLSTDGVKLYWTTPATLSVNTAEQYIWTNTHTFSNTVTIKGLFTNGSFGTAGQVLTSNGTSTYWAAAVNTDAQYTWTNTHSFTNTVTLKAVSANSSLGTNGQVLTSNGTSTYWQTLVGVNTAAQYTFTNTITFSNTITIANISANGTTGSLNQVLTSDGTKVYWKDPSGSATGTGNTAAGDTVFFINGKTVNGSYTTSATQNYLSAGPITITPGAVVTITTGSRWAVV